MSSALRARACASTPRTALPKALASDRVREGRGMVRTCGPLRGGRRLPLCCSVRLLSSNKNFRSHVPLRTSNKSQDFARMSMGMGGMGTVYSTSRHHTRYSQSASALGISDACELRRGRQKVHRHCQLTPICTTLFLHVIPTRTAFAACLAFCTGPPVAMIMRGHSSCQAHLQTVL